MLCAANVRHAAMLQSPGVGGHHSLLLSNGPILPSIQKAQISDTLHETGSRIAKKSASGFQCAVDSNMVLGGHVEIARLGRMVRSLLRYIVGSLSTIEIPIAREDFAQDRVEGLLDASSFNSQWCYIFNGNGAASGARELTAV